MNRSRRFEPGDLILIKNIKKNDFYCRNEGYYFVMFVDKDNVILNLDRSTKDNDQDYDYCSTNSEVYSVTKV
jgi:hypothetical protein